MRLDVYGFDAARHRVCGLGYPIRLIEHDDTRDAHTFRPGDTVSHWTDIDSFGIVVSIARREVTVLWSSSPTRTLRGWTYTSSSGRTVNLEQAMLVMRSYGRTSRSP